MILPDPESLRCFLAAARLLNFRAAAQAVHLTPAALGKRIQQLERRMGVELFQRTTRKVELTEAGLALLPRAGAALDASAACVRAARGEDGPPPQELMLGTRHELGMSWVLPNLRVLAREHPHVTLNLYFSSGPDLELRVRTTEIDCAITSRPLEDPRVDGLRLHEEEYVFVGQPRLLKRLPLRRTEQAADHTLIDVTRTLALFGYWRGGKGGRPLQFGRVRLFGTVAAIKWLVLRGEGVAVLPRYLVQPELERGRLKAIFPRVAPRSDHFRLIFRRDDPRRSVFERLAETLRALPLR